MSYKILSLKWRPSSFDQIIGQDHITKTLINAISMKRLAQSFLFSGPRGVGKTTTARVLASTINDIKEYDKCLDIIELDGASNRGIDEIREIRESVKFPPSTVKYKVYIIDEAHMLTEQAFNALLKTLEEPPEYIIFILATTDPQKMPQTILSRTQRYDFIRIPIDIISKRLKFILNQEEIDYEDNAIQLISKKSDGSMRDGLSILDQVIAFSDNNISINSIRLAIGLIDEEDMYDLILNIIKKDINNTISKLNKIIDSGISENNFINDFCSFLDDCMLIKINNKNSYLSEELKTKINSNLSLGYKDILKMLNMALNLSARMKTIQNPKISLEVLFLRYVGMIKTSTNDINNQEIKENNSLGSIKPPKEKLLNNIKEYDNDNTKNNEVIIENKSISNKDKKSDSNIENKNKIDIDIIKSNWGDIINKLDSKNSKLSSFLDEIKIQGFSGNILKLNLEDGNDFIKKVLDSDKKTIIEAIKNICGFSVDILITVSKIEKKDNDNKDTIEKEHPLLEDAIKIFKGKIIS